MNPLIQLEATATDEETEPKLADIINAVRQEYDTDMEDPDFERRIRTWFDAACHHWARVMTYGDHDARSLAIVAVVLERQDHDMIPALIAGLMDDTTIDDMRGFLDIAYDHRREDLPSRILSTCTGSGWGYVTLPSIPTMKTAMRHLDAIIQNSADATTAAAHATTALLASAAGMTDTARDAAQQSLRIDPGIPYDAWLEHLSR